jgi:hypothetical protein
MLTKRNVTNAIAQQARVDQSVNSVSSSSQQLNARNRSCGLHSVTIADANV